MSMWYDYFRMSDEGAATALVTRVDEDPSPFGDASMVDTITVKNIDPLVVLGRLVSLAPGAEWDVDIGEVKLVCSASEREGPGLMSLDDATRDTLTGPASRVMSTPSVTGSTSRPSLAAAAVPW